MPFVFSMKFRLLITLFLAIPATALLAQEEPSDQVTPVRRQPAIGQPQPVFVVQTRFSGQPSDTELQLATVFADRLVPMSNPPLEGENVQLAAALQQFLVRADHEDVSMLEAFVQQYAASRWNASLLLNIGLERYETGYLTQALAGWEGAWNLAKNETTLPRRAIADRAIGEILLLNARLGRVPEVERYLVELGERPVEGAVAANVQAAKEGLTRMRLEPGIAFKCGPFALNSILNYRDKTPDRRAVELDVAQSTPQGTNLLQVRNWAAEVGLDYQMAKREPSAQIVYPAVMHWKLDHFAALLTESEGRYLVQDATFGGTEMWITAKALEAETDGYYLIPAGPLPAGWRSVSDEEAQTVWGKGGASGEDKNAKRNCPPTPKGNPDCPKPGMPVVNYYLMQASLNIQDIPLYYQPPVGPPVVFLMNYNHDETGTPEINTHSNLGPNWDFNWVGYLEVDKSYNVQVRLRDGGTEVYHFSLFNNLTNAFRPDLYSQAVLKWTKDNLGRTVYRRELRDGSAEVYSQPGQTNTIGRYYLKEVVDPQGNKITVNYEVYQAGTAISYADSPDADDAGKHTSSAGLTKPTWTGRINEIVDAAGGTTFIRYASNVPTNAGFRKIKRIIDPYGRVVEFTYDGSVNAPGKIISIKDVVGMVSSFNYAADGFIEVMTTPYGKTLCHRYNRPGTFTLQEEDDEDKDVTVDEMMRGLKVTYPNGSTSVVERWLGSTLKSFHWNKLATKHYPLEPQLGDPKQYQHCEIYEWRLVPGANEMSAVPRSVKRPLEDKVSYEYEDDSEQSFEVGPDGAKVTVTHNYTGGSDQPTEVKTGNQAPSSAQYNLLGNLTELADPRGRTTRYYYDGNGVDLLEVRQLKKADGAEELLAKMTNYNAQHLPAHVYDAAGKLTQFEYNKYGQITKATDALGGVTTFTYQEALGSSNTLAHDSLLETIDGPLEGTGDITSFTYDDLQRLLSVTDADGYTTWYEYDDLNRIVRITYQPQGATLAECEYEEVVWDRLDPVLIRDRQGRLTKREYNEMGWLVAETDSEGRRLEFDWCSCGSLMKLIDGNGNGTRWEYDEIGRITKKIREGGREEIFAYEPGTGRLKSVTIAGEVRKELGYNDDDSIDEIRFSVRRRNAEGEPMTDSEGKPVFDPDPKTSAVHYVYSLVYPRLESIENDQGLISYQYYPYRKKPTDAALLGAGAVKQVDYTGLGTAVTYAYDPLGRVADRSIYSLVNGALVDNDQHTSFDYDATGRIEAMTDTLGTFGYNYDQPDKGLSRLQSITNPNGTTTTFDWHGASKHHRLREIAHSFTLGTGAAAATRNVYGYGHGGQLRSWSRQEDIGSGEDLTYSSGEHWALEHDDADQLRAAVVRSGDASGDIIRQYYYSYDQGGNRTSAQQDHSVMQFTHNKLNQINGRPGGGLVRFEGTLDEPGTVSINGKAARMRTVLDENQQPQFRFSADVALQEGVNRTSVIARDGTGNDVEQLYDVDVIGLGGQGVPTYDSRGNMTDNGRGQQYKWDAANRLITIDYADGSRTEFAYDALGRRMRETEKDESGATITDKRLLWCGLEICQERDAANAVVRRYSSHGFVGHDGKKWFYARDHLGSVTHLTDEAGQVVDRNDYDPYGAQGQQDLLANSLPNDPSLWLRADQVGSGNIDGNGKVLSWPNGGATGQPATATSYATGPQQVPNELNGKPVMRFDGLDDEMRGTLYTDISQNDYTIIVVHRPTGNGERGLVSVTEPTITSSPPPQGGTILGVHGAKPYLGTNGDDYEDVESGTTPTGWQVTMASKQGGNSAGGYGATLRLLTYGNSDAAYEATATQTWTTDASTGWFALARLRDSNGAPAGYYQGDVAEVIAFPRALTNGERAQVGRYLENRYRISRPFKSTFRYTGHYFHPKSGLHLAPYRAYDANLGVWISEDPIEEEGGVNFYQYSISIPILFKDPDGLSPSWALPPELAHGDSDARQFQEAYYDEVNRTATILSCLLPAGGAARGVQAVRAGLGAAKTGFLAPRLIPTAVVKATKGEVPLCTIGMGTRIASAARYTRSALGVKWGSPAWKLNMARARQMLFGGPPPGGIGSFK